MAVGKEITAFKPLYIARSDGESEIKTPKYGREFNGPTDAQLDKNSDEDDYYELLSPGDEKAVQWKAELGEMLRQEMNRMHGPNDVAWILADFPENYRLYKHAQKRNDRMNDSNASNDIKSKKSSKGDEWFLYGYPFDRKKRYRTPKEFFPHLLWLAEGKSEEHTDCECKHCCPSWFEDYMKTMKPLPGRERVGDPPPLKGKEKAAAAAAAAAAKQPTAPSSLPTVIANPQVIIKQRPPSQDIKVPNKPPPKKAAPTPVAKAPAPISQAAANRGQPSNLMLPTAIPAAKSQDQDLDTQVGKFIYRPGELTWFNRGTAWGLSVVVKRELFKDQRNQDCPRYLVQPLSHPFAHPTTKIISSETDLRPWLAWSAPGPTHQALTAPNLNYNTIDWKAVVGGVYGNGDAEVDGSIYAAKMIDDSFSLIEQLSNNTITTGERSYNGIYFGGEKLWVGEPIRLRVLNNQQDIMIIHQIIEKLKANSTNAASATIHISGDVYRYTTVNYLPGQEPAENPHLPIRLRQDLTYRNRLTIASKRTISYWKIVQAATRITITDVKGRWYESSILLPIIQGAANFAADVQRGEIGDVGVWINGRGDANSAPGRPGTRYKDRKETFGKAVPATLEIGKGVETPVESSNVPAAPPPHPVENTAQQQSQQVQGVNDGDISQFMDLDYAEAGGQY
ncbi:hypothetical protein ACLMJK_003457 [Lecanora helva]